MKKVLLAVLVSAAFFTAQAKAETLNTDTVWKGRVRVNGQLLVEHGATLTIEPGTVVEFAPGKLDDEGLAETGMTVKGTIIAKGTPDKKIRFTSGADKPGRGDWGEIKLFSSAGSEFADCDFSYGGWGLHVHDSALKISGCAFHDNSYGGIRLKAGQVEISGCDILGMEIGIRYWLGSPSIHHNNITGNGTGIFCRQGGDGSVIRQNNICDNTEYNIKLGDMQKGDVTAANNWWGSADAAVIRKKIYDRERDGYIGRVIMEPALKDKVEIR